MKHFSTQILMLVLLVVAVLSGYNYFKKPFLARFTEQMEQEIAPSPSPTLDPVEAALNELSVKDRVMQMIAFPALLPDAEATVSASVAWIAENHPGFITLFGSNLAAEQTAEFIETARLSSGTYAPLIAVDHEGGAVQRLSGEGFSRLPAWRQNCQSESAERSELFAQSASELRQVGVQVVFAPVLDVARPNSFIGTRACDTPENTIVAATDYITSFAQYGILSVVKHYPGIGSLMSDPHFQFDSVAIEAQDTLPFNSILLAFPNLGVMTTHVAVADRAEGISCSLSSVCLDPFPVHFPEVLLFTDALEMGAALTAEGQIEPSTLAEVAYQSVLAGNHVLVFGEQVTAAELNEVALDLVERYDTDDLLHQKIDDSVSKILQLKVPLEEN